MKKLSRRFFLKAAMTFGGAVGLLGVSTVFGASCGDDKKESPSCRYGRTVGFVPGYGFRLKSCS